MKFKQLQLPIIFLAVLLSTALRSQPAGIPVKEVPFAYRLFKFDASEGWRLAVKGDHGSSSLQGNSLVLDFTKGAKSISLIPEMTSMLGRVEKIRLKVRGSAGNHPVHVFIQSHFMTFHKVAGTIAGSGEQELVIDAPPGNGWSWTDGENDGEVHGPLRLMEIRFEKSNIDDILNLQLLSISVDGKIADDRLCVLTSGSDLTVNPVTFFARIRSLSDKPLNGKLKWAVLSWDRKELEKGERNVRISPSGIDNVFHVKTGLKNPALKFAEAVFNLEIPGQSVPSADACWLAPNEIQNDTGLVAETSFGMGAYLGRYHGKELEQMAVKARESGVKWIREDFDWGQIEPEKGKFEWAFTDSVVSIARKNGISVYAIVAYWPQWSRAYTKEGIDEYVIYLKELVRRYKDHIKQWEIWNEPNIFFWQGPQEMYAELLMKSYIAIKDVDPSAQVLGISTSGVDFDFIRKMQGLQVPFDVLTIHPYRSVFEEEKFINELKMAADMIVLPGGIRRPVWITEMGWTTYNPHNWWNQEGFLPTPLRLQAELIARAYLSCIISGVDPKVFWYDLRNDGTDPHNFEDNIGIMNRDFTPKPAYIAYSTMTRTLKGMKYIKTLSLPSGICSGLFEDELKPGHRVIAVWSPAEDIRTELEVNADRVILINTMGEKSELPVLLKGQRKFVTLYLRKGAPVYVELTNSGA